MTLNMLSLRMSVASILYFSTLIAFGHAEPKPPTEMPSDLSLSIRTEWDGPVALEPDGFDVDIQLTNNTTETVFVSPVIGQMCRDFEILIRPAGPRLKSIPPTDRYPRTFFREDAPYSRIPGVDTAPLNLDDLFRLMPGRTLHRHITLPLLPVLKKAGGMEISATLDCSQMKEIDKHAFSGILVTKPTYFPVVRFKDIPDVGVGGKP